MDGSRSKSDRIPETGLTIVFEPDEPTLDIVFLHGFTGHPEHTWAHKKGDYLAVGKNPDSPTPIGPGFFPSSSSSSSSRTNIKRIAHVFSRSRNEAKDHTSLSKTRAVYWPRDLLPTTVPGARVLTYGYDTHLRHVFGPSLNKTTLYDISWDFLIALEATRRPHSSRPILFVAHSLGGIVVKEMLRRSGGCRAGQSHLQDIFESTIGIVFFGTPHGGADPRGLPQLVMERLVKMAGLRVNEHMVNTLLPSSDRLRELRDEFVPLASEKRWNIHSFQEELGVAFLSGNKVVDDTSSYLNTPFETTQHIRRNHMEMCRFTGLDDTEYKKVAAAFDRLARPKITVGNKSMVPRAVDKTKKTAELSPLSDEDRKVLLDSLRFDQLDSRQRAIRTAHAETCGWILQTPKYLDWLEWSKVDQHGGFLWIKGKPGTGKSTLMKFALSEARKSTNKETIISFFFNARGADLERTTVGMYRSLLFQLFELLPELLQAAFDAIGFAPWSITDHIEWSRELLKDLLRQAVRLFPSQTTRSKGTICFIDALDECDEDEIRDMVSFFRRLGLLALSANCRFQVLFSSRHYPHITIPKGLSLILERQAGHSDDIKTFIDSELKLGRTSLEEEIRGQLQEKSSGIFMWVVLVVGILNKEYDQGRTARHLQKKLASLPSDLHALFRDILTRDCNNRDELIVCLQWVLFAQRPLTAEELYFAILSDTDLEDILPAAVSRDTTDKFILGSSKGLVEVLESVYSGSTAQFIHESVRDFLMKGNGLREIFPDQGKNWEAESHARLARCCVTYLNYTDNHNLDVYDQMPIPGGVIDTSRFRFLRYATRFVLQHAEKADIGQDSQKDFISNFPSRLWVRLSDAGGPSLPSQNASLVYILALNNCPSLLRSLSSRASCFQAENEVYGLPIFAAVASNNLAAAEALLALEVELHPSIPGLKDLPKHFTEGRRSAFVGFTSFRFDAARGAISHVTELGDGILLAWQLAIDPTGVNSKDSRGRTPLLFASMSGQDLMIELLLKTGRVDVNCGDQHGMTPLAYAIYLDRMTLVKTLILHGADVNTVDCNNQTPIMQAARLAYRFIFEFLFEKGADIQVKDRHENTFLELAMCDRSLSRSWMREFLLGKGLSFDLTTEEIIERLSLYRGHTDGGTNISKVNA